MRRRENPKWSERQTPDNITPQVNLRKDGILYVDFSAYDRITLASFQYVHTQHVTLCPVGKVPILFKENGVGSI